MGLSKHSKNDPRFDETCHITHKGLLAKVNERRQRQILESEIEEEINLYSEEAEINLYGEVNIICR